MHCVERSCCELLTPPGFASDGQCEALADSGSLSTAINPLALGPAGEELATDLAWFGPADAERVFVSISGTHGQEYFCGAATQLNWIAEGGL